MLLKSNPLVKSTIKDSKPVDGDSTNIERGIVARLVRYVIQEIIDFEKFIARPNLCSHKTASAKDCVVRASLFALLLLIFEAPIILVLNEVQMASGITEISPLGKDILFNVLLITILGPLLEEVIFRAGLRQPICCLFLIPLITLAFFATSTAGIVVFSLGTIALVAIAIVLIDKWKARPKFHFARAFRENYRPVFILNCFMFAIGHVRTYEYVGMQCLVVILLTIPQFISASVMGYLRIRYGILSSIIVHGLMNLAAVGAYMLSHSPN